MATLGDVSVEIIPNVWLGANFVEANDIVTFRGRGSALRVL